MATGYVQVFKGKIYAEHVDVGTVGLTLATADGLTASTTQTLAGGLPLKAAVNNIATVAHAGDAVTLPPLRPGQSCVIFNSDAVNACKVFPPDAATAIDGGSAGASVNLTHAKRCEYRCIASGVIISAQLGAASA